MRGFTLKYLERSFRVPAPEYTYKLVVALVRLAISIVQATTFYTTQPPSLRDYLSLILTRKWEKTRSTMLGMDLEVDIRTARSRRDPMNSQKDPCLAGKPYAQATKS
jgi:hypothetical protein